MELTQRLCSAHGNNYPFPVTHHGTQHPANVFGVISAGHVSNRVTSEIQTLIQNGEADVQNVFFILLETEPHVMMKEMTSVS